MIKILRTVLLTSTLLVPVSGISLGGEDFSFESQLVDAAEQNNASIVKLLLEQGSVPDERGKFETTALHRAAYKNYPNIVGILVNSGADVNATDFGGATPLHMAARQGNADILNKLISAGADLNKKDNEGYTPLHRAVISGRLSAAEILASAGADVNNKSETGDTPLIEAVRSNNPDMVNTLVSKGASKQEKNNSGKTAIDYALSNRNSRINNILSNNNQSVDTGYQPDNYYQSNISDQNVAAPVAKVEEFNNPVSNTELEGRNYASNEKLPWSGNNESKSGSIINSASSEFEIPAVILPNSERSKMANTGEGANNFNNKIDGYDELLPIAEQKNIELPNLGSPVQESPVQQDKFAAMDNSTLLPQEQQFSATPKSFADNNTVNVSDLRNNILSGNLDDFSGKPASFRYLNMSSQYSSGNLPVSNSGNIDNDIPAANIQPASGNVAEFNFQRFTAEKLFTQPVKTIQVVRLTGSEKVQNRSYFQDNGNSNPYASVNYASANNSYDVNLSENGLTRKSYDDGNILPKSMQYSKNLKAGKPVSNAYVVTYPPVYSNNPNSVNVPASMNRGATIQPYNYQATNDSFSVSSTINQMPAVPVQQIIEEAPPAQPISAGYTSKAMNSSVSNSGENNSANTSWVDTQQGAEIDKSKITSSIGSFYNQQGGYEVTYDLSNLEAQRANNVAAKSNQNIGSYAGASNDMNNTVNSSATPNGAFYGSINELKNGNVEGEYPVVNSNYADGPKSFRLWRSLPENKKAQVYSRIVQQNAPVISPVKQVNNYTENNYPSQSSGLGDVNISLEPVAASEAAQNEIQNEIDSISQTSDQNAKVPPVLVEEEIMENISSKEKPQSSDTGSTSNANNVPELASANAPALPEIAAIPEPTLPDEIKEPEQSAAGNTSVMPDINTPYGQEPEDKKLEQPEQPENIAQNIPAEAPETELSGNVIDYTPAVTDNDLTGTHAVLGAFNSSEEAVDYFNKISLRLGLLYNYKTVRSADGKFFLSVGKLEDENDANKVCAVYSNTEVSCSVFANLTPDAEKIRDMQVLDSRKVYSMVGEFKTEEESRNFFMNNAKNFKADYKVAHDPEANIYLLQIGPLFNGGDGKKVCDDMKAPDIKCKVSLK